MADALAPGIVAAQAIGRLGNYFNQELYGGPTTLPWGLEIYERVDATGLPDLLGGVALDHTPIAGRAPHVPLRAAVEPRRRGAVVWADRRFRLGHGRAFALYVAGYTAGRFWIELMRTDEASRPLFGLRINVLVSVVVFVGAVVYFVLAKGKGEREDIAALRASEEAEAGEAGEAAEETQEPAKPE